ncbi:hypothetical protein CYMTET_15847 [Cymbomonas tetramitiformis]|uniref:Uncharacterized protein n=1 Tax=Cymbomonas tetramitiformis TaxID=36881 RepID=A0AAE0GD61_9CHLO|nr:hypothetical protein CYMTET_15847 [Cymbomonas tetramitiformis]
MPGLITAGDSLAAAEIPKGAKIHPEKPSQEPPPQQRQRPRSDDSGHKRTTRPKAPPQVVDTFAQAKVAWGTYLKRMAVFSSRPPQEIYSVTIPWLPMVEIDWQNVKLLRELEVDTMELTRVWHPDKFLQKYGDRLVAAEREMILLQVTTISQVLNLARQQLAAPEI